METIAYMEKQAGLNLSGGAVYTDTMEGENRRTVVE